MMKFHNFFTNNNSAVILFFALMFGITLYLLYGCVLCCDDICFNFLEGGIKFYKDELIRGTFAMHLDNILSYWLPYKLQINIQDFSAVFGNIFKASVITTIFIYFHKFLTDAKINKKISLLVILILYFSFFIYQQPKYFVDFVVNEGFFRFIMPVCFYEILLYYCLKIYTEEKETGIYKLALFAAITAGASELTLLLSSLTAGLFIFLSKDKRKKYLIIFSGIIAGAFLVIFNKYFWLNFIYKLNYSDSSLSFSFTKIAGYIPEYTKMVTDKIIIGYFPAFAIILTCLYLNFKNLTDEISKKYFKFLCLSLVVTIFFVYSFMFAGKSSYQNNFWLDHNDLYSVFDVLFMTLTVLGLCSVSNLIAKIDCKKIIVSLIIIIWVLLPFQVNCCIFLKNGVSNIRKHIYLTDKINLFYLYKDIPVKLPNFAKFYVQYVYMNKNNIDVYEEKFMPDISEMDLYKLYKNKNYYPIVYKTPAFPEDMGGPFAETNAEALDYFIENGGNFDEIYTGKYKFSDLENKDFVLGQSK